MPAPEPEAAGQLTVLDEVTAAEQIQRARHELALEGMTAAEAIDRERHEQHRLNWETWFRGVTLVLVVIALILYPMYALIFDISGADLAEKIAPITGIAGAIVGYWFGQASRRIPVNPSGDGGGGNGDGGGPRARPPLAGARARATKPPTPTGGGGQEPAAQQGPGSGPPGSHQEQPLVTPSDEDDFDLGEFDNAPQPGPPAPAPRPDHLRTRRLRGRP